MRTTALLTNNDARRRSAVEFIQNTYAARYNVRLEVFPSRIRAVLDDCEDILCAACLRFLDDGFLSERYLDVPIEDVVGAISARAVNRDAIFEVTTFASRAPAWQPTACASPMPSHGDPLRLPAESLSHCQPASEDGL